MFIRFSAMFFFNIQMLPITCLTFKRNESGIPYKTADNPHYCNIILRKQTPVCHHFCGYIQRSHVAYVQADFGHVIYNILSCPTLRPFRPSCFTPCRLIPRCTKKYPPCFQDGHLIISCVRTISRNCQLYNIPFSPYRISPIGLFIFSFCRLNLLHN